jgi:hypothetical protein
MNSYLREQQHIVRLCIKDHWTYHKDSAEALEREWKEFYALVDAQWRRNMQATYFGCLLIELFPAAQILKSAAKSFTKIDAYRKNKVMPAIRRIAREQRLQGKVSPPTTGRSGGFTKELHRRLGKTADEFSYESAKSQFKDTVTNEYPTPASGRHQNLGFFSGILEERNRAVDDLVAAMEQVDRDFGADSIEGLTSQLLQTFDLNAWASKTFERLGEAGTRELEKLCDLYRDEWIKRKKIVSRRERSLIRVDRSLSAL